MPKAAMQRELGATSAPGPAWAAPPKARKLPALLVTSDDSLWNQMGSFDDGWTAKQFDSVEELVSGTPSGQPGVVLWDARGFESPTAYLSRIQSHSERFVIVAIDATADPENWTGAIQQRQVVAQLGLPIDAMHLSAALRLAREEITARMTLLGDGAADSAGVPRATRKIPRTAILAVLGLGAIAAVAAIVLVPRPDGSSAVKVSEPTAARQQQESGKPNIGVEETVDSLVDRAQKAMVDRHYLDPAESSALSLYRQALILDPSSGEARQGLARLAQVLVAKVQSALDDHKFDVALQALEIARSISPGDSRVTALDARIAAVRNELGPAQIQAAINAQNFDRATQLIDEAARAKVLGNARLAQLRDEVRHQREQSELRRFEALIDARLQQDRLIDPSDDSVAYYLNEARRAGVRSPALQSQSREFLKRSAEAARDAIGQHRYADAERLLAELHNNGAPAGTVTGLRRDLNSARTRAVHEKLDQTLLETARIRLAQGNLTEPENDSALYYVNQLRSADAQNTGVVQVSGAVQSQLLARARAAIDAGDPPRAEALLRLAESLGPSPEADVLRERLLSQVQPFEKASAPNSPPEVAEAALTRTKALKPTYPGPALARGIEGWVELAYTVTTAGKVVDVRVLNSTPPGVFEAAATDAAAGMRYRPVEHDGKAIAVTTKIRVAFRVSAG